MKRFRHLTEEQRYHLYILLKEHFSKTEICKRLKIHRSTLWREIKRNSGFRGYRPKQAQRFSDDRKANAFKRIIFDSKMKNLVELGIKKGLSPVQISNRLILENHGSVSHERIYQHIIEDKKLGGNLFSFMRQGNKKRKKRYGKYDKRGQIKDRVSIEKRPKIVDKKIRKGDWEIDTVVGKNHKGVLITVVERKTSFTLMKYVKTKNAVEIAGETVKLLKPYQNKVHTITADNGKEFANHKYISKRLKAKVYFAHPYHSWERGLNENTNGLIRQYFKKGTSFENITDEEVKEVMTKLNERPRKKLNYKTPFESFLGKRTIVF
jgi:IS30 family transposase